MTNKIAQPILQKDFKKNWYTGNFKKLMKQNNKTQSTIFGLQFSHKIRLKPIAPKSMKKLIYILLVSITASLAITSCTEENVAPSRESNSGGNTSNDALK